MLTNANMQSLDKVKRFVKKSLILGQYAYINNRDALLNIFFKKDNEAGLKEIKKMYDNLGQLQIIVDIIDDEITKVIRTSNREGSVQPKYNRLKILKRMKPLSIQLKNISNKVLDLELDPSMYSDEFAFDMKKSAMTTSNNIEQMRKDIKVFISRMERFLKEN